MSLFENIRELPFGTNELWPTIGKSEETKRTFAFTRFKEKIGEGRFGKLSKVYWKRTKQSEVVAVSLWLQAVHHCSGREQSSFLFLKAGDKIPM